MKQGNKAETTKDKKMRKITSESSKALRNGINLTKANMQVKHNLGVSEMRLHGNKIASVINSQLTLNDCGWLTTTTKERLNGILNEFHLPFTIRQVKGNWLIVGENTTSQWTGKHTFDTMRQCEIKL